MSTRRDTSVKPVVVSTFNTKRPGVSITVAHRFTADLLSGPPFVIDPTYVLHVSLFVLLPTAMVVVEGNHRVG